MEYVAKSLGDIADVFELYASDQIASKRWQSTAKAKAKCDTEAYIWRQAADILRNTKIETPALAKDTTRFQRLSGVDDDTCSG